MRRLIDKEEIRSTTLSKRFYMNGIGSVVHYGKEYLLDKDGYVWAYEGKAQKRDKNNPAAIALYTRKINKNKKRKCIGRVHDKSFKQAWKNYGNCCEAGDIIQYFLREGGL